MVSKFHLKTLWSKAKISRKHLKNNLFLFLPMVVSYLLFFYQVSWKDFTTITRWCVTCSFEIWLLPSSFKICEVASGRWYIFHYKVYSLYCSKCTACLTYLSLNITTIIFQWWCKLLNLSTTKIALLVDGLIVFTMIIRVWILRILLCIIFQIMTLSTIIQFIDLLHFLNICFVSWGLLQLLMQ